MAEFVVHVTTDAVIDSDRTSVWDELGDAVAGRFAGVPEASSVAPFDGRVGAVIALDAEHFHDAARLGADGLLDILARQGMTANIVAVEVLTAAEFDQRTHASV